MSVAANGTLMRVREIVTALTADAVAATSMRTAGEALVAVRSSGKTPLVDDELARGSRNKAEEEQEGEDAV